MQEIKLSNTLTRQKEEFKPLVAGQVKMYYCGPTVYWTQHIGNLRGAFCADLVVRTLRYFGYEVNFVRNYTDVGHLTSDQDFGEDKMIKGAEKEGKTPEEIAQKYIKVFEQDARALNLLDPDAKPRATQNIEEMIAMVQTLIVKGFAYTTDLAVYFDLSKFPNYTALSGQNLEENRTGAGKADISDEQKKNSADFALWFFKAGAHQNAIQTWPSPFVSKLVENGQGFPGWHIECSAMIKKYLGDTIDIHFGGIEHIPVHHTNEIAQSESANGVKFVNYWLHNEHLLVNNAKMSKSEGTGYSLQEVIDKGFNPLVLRYFFLQAHYRSKQNFTWEELAQQQIGLERIWNNIRNWRTEPGQVIPEYLEKFNQALADDFNTPKALAVLQEVIKSEDDSQDKRATVVEFDKVLGLNLNQDTDLTPEQNDLIYMHQQARLAKDFAKSDQIREELLKQGIKLINLTDNQYRIEKS